MPWQRIVSGIENSAASHERLAQKIETDVEKPLRQFSTRDSEMKAATGSQSNLASMAKDLNAAQKKAEKAKGGKKEGEASSGVGEASRQWESQAPYIFEQLQAVDEKRVNHLRDVLTQLQTHEADQVERNRASAESCLNALLNLETADEIKTFTERAATGRTYMQRRRSSVTATRPPTSNTLAPPEPPPPRSINSRRESSTSNQDRLPALPEQTPSKSKLGGLKRLGTVMSRRKSTMPPPPTPEKKKDRRSMMPFRRGDSSRSFQDLEESGRDLTPVQSEQPSHGSLQQLPSAEAASRDNVSSQVTEPAAHLTNGANGISGYQPPPGPPPSHTNAQAVPAPSDVPEQSAPWQPSPSAQTESIPSIAPIQPQSTGTTENEESARAFAIRDQPIREDETEAQQALSNLANQLRVQGATSGISRVQGSVRGRRDVRNTMFIPAGVDVLSAGATSPSINTAVPAAAPSSPPLPTSSSATDLASPIQQPLRQRTLLEDHALGSDAGSVHSAHSLAALAHHPELHEPGLNASIVETVNTWFSASGATKSIVTGEVALAYNPTPSSTETTSPTETETIRLQHFELLEKVAANPTFITAATKSNTTSAEEHAGTYRLAINSIKRPTPTVGLKYQLHIDEANLAAYSPLLLTPAWQLIDGQASVIVLYSLNPAFASPQQQQQSLTFKNVAISIRLDVTSADAPKPTAAQMAPREGAKFRRKVGTVTWRFAELSVKSAAEQERLVVRFTTAPGAGVPRQGGVDVKFEVHGRAASEVGVLRRRAVEGGVSKEGKGVVDPFADEEAGASAGVAAEAEAEEVTEWVEVPTRRGVVSGKYTAT